MYPKLKALDCEINKRCLALRKAAEIDAGRSRQQHVSVSQPFRGLLV